VAKIFLNNCVKNGFDFKSNFFPTPKGTIFFRRLNIDLYKIKNPVTGVWFDAHSRADFIISLSETLAWCFGYTGQLTIFKG